MTSSSRTSTQEPIKVEGRKVRQMFGSIASRYDLANSFLSLGVHKIWRRALSKNWRGLPKDTPVLDLCTGTGDILFDLQKYFSTCIGADFCFPMLAQGRARRSGALFLQGDALKLPFKDDTFGLVTMSFGARNLESLSTGLEEVRRVLRPGGKVLIMEFGQPHLPVWSSIFSFYSDHILPLIGGFVTGNRDAYRYLPETSKAFPCGAEFVSKLEAAGFEAEKWCSLSGGIAYIYPAAKIEKAVRLS